MNNPSGRHIGLALGLAVLMGVFTVGAGIFYSADNQAAARASAQTAQAQQPQPRPAFALPDLNGVRQHIKQWDGKVVVVNFWATWCPPCREEIPLFNDLQRRYGPKGVQFIGVAVDDVAAVRHYMKNTPINFPVLIGEDEGMSVAQRYGNDAGVLPYTAIIGRDGHIAFVQFGILSRAQAEQTLNSLL